jgi:hypothetical protein
MPTRLFAVVALIALGLFALGLPGCSPEAEPPAEETPNEPEPQPGGEAPRNAQAQPSAPQTAEAPRRSFQPIQLGGNGGTSSAIAPGATTGAAAPAADLGSVFDALKPLNILVGEWATTTRTKGAGEAGWRIDPKTARTQPALVMNTKGHPYFREARLTYLPQRRVFQMSATDADGTARTYEGTYTEEPQTVTGDDGKPQRTYKLDLNEVGNVDARQLVRVQLNQQENNRMLMAVYRRVGEQVQIQDTVANQRKGTSFALSDSDYGERECIISQGLGTMSVSYMGKSYPVCCSGCAAAFNDNPEFWIAQAAERKAKAGKE